MQVRSNTPYAGYLLYADFIRILAVTAVIILHVSSRVVASWGQIPIAYWWAGNIADSTTRWAVPGLVMLSGALLLDPGKEENLFSFFQKRASRLAIPMLSWFFVYFLWVHYWQRQPITFPLVVRRLILGGPYYHLYFLYVIGFLYAITPLLKPYFTKLHPSQRVRVIAFCLSLGIIDSLIFYRFYNHEGWFDQLSSFFPMFAFSFGFIGYFLAGYHLKTLVLFQNRSVLFLAFFILSVLTTLIGTYGFISRFGLYSFGLYFYDNFSPPCIIMSFSTFLFIKETVGRVPIQHNRKFVDLTRRLLAPAAFGVYLLHPIVLDVLWYFLISIPPEKQQSIVSLDAWSGIPLISAGVIVATFGATVLIQRLPYVRRVVGRM